jgi:hypothetical protein
MGIFKKLKENLKKGILIDLDATFSKPFFKKNPLGRTISGKNKTGQALQSIGQIALSFTPFGDKLIKATGRITGDDEAREIAESKGIEPYQLPRLNLKDWELWALRIGIVATVAGLYWATTQGYISQEIFNALSQWLLTQGG